MTSYYNEIEPYAAQWLRNLIAARLIAPGDVDERSIADVRPDELAKYTQCHFFAGIGVWSHALRAAGWDDSRPVWTGSCPCQPFSAAGKQLGVNDERHLWPVFERLIAECRPATVFGEQVASAAGRDWLSTVRADLEALGYGVGAADLCAAGAGAPHIRQRLYWVADADCQRQQREHALLQWQEPRWISKGCTETSGGIKVGGLADAESLGSAVRQPLHGELQRLGSDEERKPCGLADTKSSRRGVRHSDDQRKANGKKHALGNNHQAGRLADANGGRLNGHGQQHGDAQQPGQQAPSGEYSGGCLKDGGLANAAGQQEHQELQGSATAQGERGANGSGRCGMDGGLADNGGSSTDHGGWRTADWLFCRDSKWRPVEPGTFPLAHGVASRVGRLRAYGNAIVPQVASAFIEAFLKCKP